MDPADFYTGLVAEAYAPLKSFAQPSEPYEEFIIEHGQPALELACGDGEPLLALRERGLDVDGVDSSAEMLDRCRAGAAASGLEVALHHQRMEALDLGRRYRSIFLAGPSIILLPDDDAYRQTLRGIAAHLAPDGAALVPLHIPSPTPREQFGVRNEVVNDGVTLAVTVIDQERDEERRRQSTTLRYERIDGDQHEALDREWLMHWCTVEGFTELVTGTGLRIESITQHDGSPAGPEATDFTVLLRPS